MKSFLSGGSETDIFNDVKETETTDIYVDSINSQKLIELVQQVAWIDTSEDGSGHQPPDFFNVEHKLMIDTMKVDDVVTKKRGKKHPDKQRQSSMLRELKDAGFLDQLPNLDRVFLNPDMSDIPAGEHHTYAAYLSNLTRIVEGHIRSIKNVYQKNHPGFQTAFLLYDESTLYWQTSDLVDEVKYKQGQGVFGQPHIPWQDKSFLNVLMAEGLDFVIWIMPWKNPPMTEILPRIAVLDLNNVDEVNLKEYDPRYMHSDEE